MLALLAFGADWAAGEGAAGAGAVAAGAAAGGVDVIVVGTVAAPAGLAGVGRMQAVPRRVAPGGQLVGVSMIGECGREGAPWDVPERASRRFSSSDSCL